MQSTSDYLDNRTLTHIAATRDFAMRHNGFITRWISTNGLTVYAKTAIVDFDMRDG